MINLRKTGNRLMNGARAEHNKANPAKGSQRKRFDGENHPRLQRSSMAVKTARTGQNEMPTTKSNQQARNLRPQKPDWLDGDEIMTCDVSYLKMEDALCSASGFMNSTLTWVNGSVQKSFARQPHHTSTGPFGTGMFSRRATAGTSVCMKDATIGGSWKRGSSSPRSSRNC